MRFARGGTAGQSIVRSNAAAMLYTEMQGRHSQSNFESAMKEMGHELTHYVPMGYEDFCKCQMSQGTQRQNQYSLVNRARADGADLFPECFVVFYKFEQGPQSLLKQAQANHFHPGCLWVRQTLYCVETCPMELYYYAKNTERLKAIEDASDEEEEEEDSDDAESIVEEAFTVKNLLSRRLAAKEGESGANQLPQIGEEGQYSKRPSTATVGSTFSSVEDFSHLPGYQRPVTAMSRMRRRHKNKKKEPKPDFALPPSAPAFPPKPVLAKVKKSAQYGISSPPQEDPDPYSYYSSRRKGVQSASVKRPGTANISKDSSKDLSSTAALPINKIGVHLVSGPTVARPTFSATKQRQHKMPKKSTAHTTSLVMVTDDDFTDDDEDDDNPYWTAPEDPIEPLGGHLKRVRRPLVEGNFELFDTEGSSWGLPEPAIKRRYGQLLLKHHQ
eukprot:TRINITY_DN30741_c0_g1_i1.p1 TRINITY_DN30741_c0_g1~~TRINITY_DN30741_c0_g1_i1.p1  ORF type:complete len:502 (+),score=75.06 TRINITY_DN30741_c0_g1_i1:179-1507(+)